MLASELGDTLGEGVIHSNIGVTYEMLSNMEEALIHNEKVSIALLNAMNFTIHYNNIIDKYLKFLVNSYFNLS